jgi:hypothetical protein
MCSPTNICGFFCQDLASVYNLNITDIFHFSETDYVSTEQHIQEMDDIVTNTYQRTRGELQKLCKYIVPYFSIDNTRVLLQNSAVLCLYFLTLPLAGVCVLYIRCVLSIEK